MLSLIAYLVLAGGIGFVGFRQHKLGKRLDRMQALIVEKPVDDDGRYIVGPQAPVAQLPSYVPPPAPRPVDYSDVTAQLAAIQSAVTPPRPTPRPKRVDPTPEPPKPAGPDFSALNRVPPAPSSPPKPDEPDPFDSFR